MSFLLPVVSWVFLFAIIHKQVSSRREAYLHTSVIWGCIVLALTELLSLLHCLYRQPLILAWAFVLVILFVIWVRVHPSRKEVKARQAALSLYDGFLIASVFLIGVVTFFIALKAPPNTWDSMTYHMSRVMHWIQNRSLGFYPTHIERQLNINPWAEFAILHFQILTDCDRLANFIQWFSMVGSIIGTTLIAEYFNLGIRGQIATALFVATLPMGILQATSTQNDYVVSFWIICFVYFLMKCRLSCSPIRLFALGGSLGLALATKTTAYLYTLPFLVWFVISTAKISFTRAGLYMLAILSLVVALNSGHSVRNYSLYGNIFGPVQEEPRYTNDTLSLPAFISNLVRNIALHVSTPSGKVNAVLEKVVTDVHSKILQINVNASSTTWQNEAFQVNPLQADEDYSGNPLHFLLILFSFLVLIKKGRTIVSRVSIYAFCVGIGFALFCFLLRWQPWHSRLHLPLFILSAPLVSYLLFQSVNFPIRNTILLTLVASSIYWLCFSNTKPILGQESILETSRIDQYFYRRVYLKNDYLQVANYINQQEYRVIGLNIGGDDWEYPLWVLLKPLLRTGTRIEHIDIENASKNIVYPVPRLDVVLCINCHASKIHDYSVSLGPPLVFGSIYLFSMKP